MGEGHPLAGVVLLLVGMSIPSKFYVWMRRRRSRTSALVTHAFHISGDYVQPLFLMAFRPENSPVVGNFLNRPVQLHPTAHEGMVPAATTG
jgi:hypothetical protein